MISVERRTKSPITDFPPLNNGDHLDQKTFHERYEAMPSHIRAELIGGIVYMSSPLKRKYGRNGLRLSQWLAAYEDATPGTEALEGASCILDAESEPQPDGCLFILPECGGQIWEDENGYINGAPEFVGEVSDSTESIDLHSKKSDYKEAGVREYLVVAVRSQKVFWFVRRRGKFKLMGEASHGVIRSETFPGLWLDATAILKHDGKQVLNTLQKGLASTEHAAFVAKLAAKRRSSKVND